MKIFLLSIFLSLNAFSAFMKEVVEYAQRINFADRGIALSDESFDERYVSPMLQVGHGSEGIIFVDNRKSSSCIKKFREPEKSHLGLASLTYINIHINAYRLNDVLITPTVFAKGSDWLKREYFHKAVKLKTALAMDQQARSTFDELMARVSHQHSLHPDNKFLRALWQRIDGHSNNIMWLPQQQCFVLIDVF